jgi:hypothetical protein
MTDDSDYRCPDCGSTNLVTIHTATITDELIECRACIRLYRVEQHLDGSVRLVPL